MNIIRNHYCVIDNPHQDDFHIAIYYISVHKCKIIIRRLDYIDWGQDLKIMIYDLQKKESEKISLGSCEENHKIMEIYTNIDLYESILQEQIIPKVILQTSQYQINKNVQHHNACLSFIELNPEYEYKYFTDQDCRSFIKTHMLSEEQSISYKSNQDPNQDPTQNMINDVVENTMPDVLRAYDLLLPGPLKADLFRYFYLYLYGGCYFNCRMILKKPLHTWIEPHDRVIVCQENESSSKNLFDNGLICIEPKHKNLLKCIQQCVKSILAFDITKNEYELTGKYLFDSIFQEIHPKYVVRKTNSIYKSDEIEPYDQNLLFHTEYVNYYKEKPTTLFANKYFLTEYSKQQNYMFYFYPSNNQDTFEIFSVKENIFIIKRTDTNTGWGQMVQLKVIDEKDNVYSIMVGDSEKNEKIFVVKK